MLIYVHIYSVSIELGVSGVLSTIPDGSVIWHTMEVRHRNVNKQRDLRKGMARGGERRQKEEHE